MTYHRAYYTCDVCKEKCGEFNSQAILSIRKKDDRGASINDFDKQRYLCIRCGNKVIKLIDTGKVK